MSASDRSFGYMVVADRDRGKVGFDARKSIPLSGREIVPPWESKRKFKGFPSLFHALTVASSRDKICVIATVAYDFSLSRDSRKFYGRYRVYETKLKKHRFDRRSVEVHPGPHELPLNVIDIRYTHVYKRDDVRSWKIRKSDYESTLDAKQLMMDYMDLHAEEIKLNDYRIRRAALFRKGFELYDDNRVNYNQFFTAKDNEALGETVGHHVDHVCRTRTPQETPRINIVLGLDGLLNDTELFFMTTIVHEGMHAIDFYRILYLVEKWMDTKTSKSFFAWLVKTAKKKKSGITFKDLVRVVELCVIRDPPDISYTNKELRELAPLANYGINTAATIHFYPHLEGFKLKVWLGGEATILREYSKWQNRRSRNKQQKAFFPGGFSYFSDLEKIDKHYSGVDFQSGMRKLAKETASLIKQVMTGLGCPLQAAIRSYVKTTLDDFNERPKEIQGKFLKILHKEIGS